MYFNKKNRYIVWIDDQTYYKRNKWWKTEEKKQTKTEFMY